MFATKIGESCSTTGTGTYSLGGAYGAFRTWRSGFSSGDSCFYLATNDAGTIWEVGYGVLTTGSPDTLTRTVIVSGGGSGSAISWSTTPYRIYSVPSAEALKHLLAPLVNGVANVPLWLPAAALWLDYALGIAVAWVKNRYVSGTRTAAASHAEEGRFYLGRTGAVPNIYSASQRRAYVDKAAANYTLTAADLGKVLAFDCTAAVRTLTGLVSSAAGMGDGAYFFVYPYGSSTNGVTFTPGGADTTELATAPPKRITMFQYDAVRAVWVADGGQVSNASVASGLKGSISGWTYANSGGANDIDVAAGQGIDSTGVDLMVGAALTKQLSNAWAVGNAAGGLDTGAVANSDYFLWAIKRPDTGVVDYLFSLSSSAPTMPTNYTLKRLIGWVRRTAGSIVAFKTYELSGGGLNYLWSAAPLDVASASLTSSRLLSVISVPVGFNVHATISASMDASGVMRICSPDQADAAPSTTAAPFNNFGLWNTVSGYGAQFRILTNKSAQIAARAQNAVSNYYVATEGFEWSRR